MKGYLSRNEAAERLGVDPQSISNYCAKGLLSYKRKDIGVSRQGSSVIWIEEQSFEKFETGYFNEFKASEYDANEVCRLLKKDVEELASKKRLLENEIKASSCIKRFARMLPEFLEATKDNALKYVNERSQKIFTMYCQGTCISTISDEIGISTERVCQIIDKTFWSLLWGAIRNKEQIIELKKENEKLLRRNTTMHLELQSNAEERIARRKLLRQEKLEMERLCSREKEKIELLCSSVFDDKFDFSVRTLNCLKCNDILTIYDLVKIEKSRLLRTRNFGKKSCMEIEEKLDGYKLYLGMPISYGLAKMVECSLNRV